MTGIRPSLFDSQAVAPQAHHISLARLAELPLFGCQRGLSRLWFGSTCSHCDETETLSLSVISQQKNLIPHSQSTESKESESILSLSLVCSLFPPLHHHHPKHLIDIILTCAFCPSSRRKSLVLILSFLQQIESQAHPPPNSSTSPFLQLSSLTNLTSQPLLFVQLNLLSLRSSL